jgi:hypothetical protein
MHFNAFRYLKSHRKQEPRIKKTGYRIPETGNKKQQETTCKNNEKNW